MSDLEAVARLCELADGQWGMVTTAQASTAGVAETTLSVLAEANIVEPIMAGAWRIRAGGRHPAPRLYAAWLLLESHPGWQRSAPACGVVSHTAAVQLYGVGQLPGPLLEITTPQPLPDAGENCTVHLGSLSQAEFADLCGMPVTRPGRTVADLLASERFGPVEVGRIASSFLRQDWVSESELADALTDSAEGSGRSGGGRQYLNELLTAAAE